MVEIELTKISGPDQSPDDVLDWLAGTLGRDNAAAKPFRFDVGVGEDEITRYEIKCVH
jgi:hypothetical protein